MRIRIYDRVNARCLLGTIPAPAFPRARRYSVVVMPEVPAMWMQERDYSMPILHVERVDFEIGERVTRGGWRRDFIFTTDASLELLRRVRGFELPTKADELDE